MRVLRTGRGVATTLPHELQANARAFRCWTLDEFYAGFLSKLDRYQAGRRVTPTGEPVQGPSVYRRAAQGATATSDEMAGRRQWCTVGEATFHGGGGTFMQSIDRNCSQANGGCIGTGAMLQLPGDEDPPFEVLHQTEEGSVLEVCWFRSHGD